MVQKETTPDNYLLSQRILVFGYESDEYRRAATSLRLDLRENLRFNCVFTNDDSEFLRLLGDSLSSSVIVDLDGDTARYIEAERILGRILHLPRWPKDAANRNIIAITSSMEYMEVGNIVNMFDWLYGDWGIDLFIKKPFEPAIFAAQVKSIIRLLRFHR